MSNTLSLTELLSGKFRLFTNTRVFSCYAMFIPMFSGNLNILFNFKVIRKFNSLQFIHL